MEYRGAFKLDSYWDYGAAGLAYYPDGDGGAGSLYVAGNGTVGEVDIPTPVISSDPADLNLATTLQAPVNPGQGVGAQRTKSKTEKRTRCLQKTNSVIQFPEHDDDSIETQSAKKENSTRQYSEHDAKIYGT